MKSFLIATIEQTELSSSTNCSSAPLLPLVDRPVMVYTVELLARYGIRDISVVQPSRLNNIEKYFKDGKRWNVNLTYLRQDNSLDSAGILKDWADTHGETFLVVPANCFFDFNIDAALEHHHRTHAQITMILARCMDPENIPQAVQIDADSRVVGLGDNAHGHQFQATGAYICEPHVFQQIPAGPLCDIATQVIPALLAQGQKVSGFEIDGYWNPLHSFPAYKEAQEECLAALMHSQPEGNHSRIHKLYADGQHKHNGLWRAPHSVIHQSVRITPPVFVGEGSQIGPDVELGPNVVIGSHVVVDEGATIRNSTILRNTYVGQLVELNNRIVNKSRLIDAETGEYTQITDDFLLSEASPAMIGHRLKDMMGRMLGFFL
ncbi:MAG: NDP-sugar synthase [Caldilineaceae bacterium]|nr:NDP-sugar synthase [Caldilineaceae bacterium]